MFHNNTLATELLSIEFIHRVVRITIIIELNKAIPIFQIDFQ